MATTSTTAPNAEDLAKDARVLAVHAASVGSDIEIGEVRVFAGNQYAEVVAWLLDSMSDTQDALVEVRLSWTHRTKNENAYNPRLTVVGI